MSKKFEIDFFELSFLIDVCIPPVPIARTMFWHRLIDEIYYQLSDEEADSIFKWVTENTRFSKDNEDCRWFYARFNPDNQYLVSCFHRGKADKVPCFRVDDKYHTKINTWINPQYIKEVEKI